MSCAGLTGRQDDPDGVHEDKVEPKVQWLWPRVYDAQLEVVKRSCGIVQNIAIHLAEAHKSLKRIAKGMSLHNQ